MRLHDWLRRQASCLPVPSLSLADLDPWMAVANALRAFELAQMQFGPFRFEPPAVASRHRKKRSGGHRTINAPNASLRVVHDAFVVHVRRIMRRHAEGGRFVIAESGRVLRALETLPSAVAYKEGSKVANAVIQHARIEPTTIYSLDIQDAFESVDMELLATIITGILLADRSSVLSYISPKQHILYSVPEDLFSIRSELFLRETVEWVLRTFFATDPRAGRGLYQGSSASPWLFNIYCEALLGPALRVLAHGGNQAARQQGIVYTQYADNLDFTVRGHGVPKRAIRRAIENVFRVNDRKVLSRSLTRGSVSMLGYSLSSGRIVYPKKKRERLHVAIEQATVALKNGDRDSGRKLYAEAMGLHSEFAEYLRAIKTLGHEPTLSDRRTLDRLDVLRGWYS